MKKLSFFFSLLSVILLLNSCSNEEFNQEEANLKSTATINLPSIQEAWVDAGYFKWTSETSKNTL